MMPNLVVNLFIILKDVEVDFMDSVLIVISVFFKSNIYKIIVVLGWDKDIKFNSLHILK